MTPSARVQAALRNSDERSEILETLSVEVSPQDVNPVIWSRWLAGGKPPFLEKPVKP
ncbi:hypothetical protein M8312_13485 [Sphingomonas sp. KRR8]|uniref:hypothetical protein n=1 Tax=Sphingomonas sp. KRR8 TaxID=2942996 RepID=UPI002020C652|nr:hypothetical protein [Sphingomonas sp. KRR8]URD60770.1 hypothetical protein M8312_13485 [Sphingomonas sp. KRR8]